MDSTLKTFSPLSAFFASRNAICSSFLRVERCFSTKCCCHPGTIQFTNERNPIKIPIQSWSANPAFLPSSCAALRINGYTRSKSPPRRCEQFNRKMSVPASIIFGIISLSGRCWPCICLHSATQESQIFPNK